MNAERRKRANALIGQMEEISAELSQLQSEEDDAFSNMPEGLQQSVKGDRMQEIIDDLENAVQSCDEVIEFINNIIAE